MLGSEPTLIIQAVVAALVAVDAAAITMPAWLHTVIAVLIIALGAVVTRSQVSPASKVEGQSGPSLPYGLSPDPAGSVPDIPDPPDPTRSSFGGGVVPPLGESRPGVTPIRPDEPPSST